MVVDRWFPEVDDLPGVVSALDAWQRDGASVQLHSGDLGWAWAWGAEPVAKRLQVWSRGGEPAVIGMIDGSVLRLAVSADADEDADLASSVVSDVSNGLTTHPVDSVEVRCGRALRERLMAAGWLDDEPWVSLHRSLAGLTATPAERIRTIGIEQATDFAFVHRSAFGSERLTPEAVAEIMGGPIFTNARALVAYADDGAPTACIIGWSAGVGRPGIIEPMGVHADYRGQGLGTSITIAAAAALRDLGASTAMVATDAARSAALATYRAAGFTAEPPMSDLRKPS